jgi:hypothetical protein
VLPPTGPHFLEYFNSDGCAGQAVSRVGLFGPYLRTSSAIVVPTQSTGSYAGACPYSNVNACVPGYACGAPSVFMEAGGTTRRLVTAETPLW